MDGPRSMALSVNAVERALIKLQATPDAYFALFAASRILPLKARPLPPGAKILLARRNAATLCKFAVKFRKYAPALLMRAPSEQLPYSPGLVLGKEGGGRECQHGRC